MFVTSMLRSRASLAAVAGQRMSTSASGVVSKSLPALHTPLMSKQSQNNAVTKAAPLTAQLTQLRHGGVSVLGCAIALVAVGGCAQGMGQLFAALVVGIARNPSMKDDLFTYTFVGLGFVELLAIVVIIFAVMLLNSE